MPVTFTLNPYLNFNGNTAEAMEFYRSVVGGKLSMQTFGKAGMAKLPEDEDKIMHASLVNGDFVLMASDCPPSRKVRFGDNVHLSLVGTDDTRLTEIFRSLSENGKVTMPLAEQFWGDTFGMLTDKFGIHWMVNISAARTSKGQSTAAKGKGKKKK